MPQIRKVRGFLLKVDTAQNLNRNCGKRTRPMNQSFVYHAKNPVCVRAKNDQRVIRPRIMESIILGRMTLMDGRAMTKQQLRLEELSEEGRQWAKHPELKPKPRPEVRGMAFSMAHLDELLAHPNGPLKRVNCKSRLLKLQVHKSPMRFSMMLLIRLTMVRAFGWMQMKHVHLGICQQIFLKALISRIVKLEEVNRPSILQRLVRCLMSQRANLEELKTPPSSLCVKSGTANLCASLEEFSRTRIL